MTMIQIPYGTKQIEMEIEGAELLDVEEVDSRRTATSENMDVIREALRKPLSTKRLREIVATKNPKSIVIVVDDHTRDTPTEIMLDALSEELGEAHKDHITLLIACGTHTTPTEEDLKRLLGKYFDHYTIKIHDCDAEDLAHVGTTSRGTPVSLNRNYVEADIKILTGDITLHYYAGFGGGRKSILPGISARETIKKNHALLVDELARTANLERNPVHLDMSEAAAFAPPDFVLNIIASGTGNVIDAYAGDLHEVLHKGVVVAKDLFCRDTHELFALLVVSAGGFPKDRTLYQATKAIENCYRAVVPGGELILVAECRDGVGDTYFERWMNDYVTYEEAEEAIRTNFVLGGHKAYYIRKVMKRLGLSIVSELDAHVLTRWQIKPYKSVGEALAGVKKDKVKIGIVKKGLDTLIMPAINL
ncbi:MAG TPA: nickel-dependent lactate racemase [Candidatus Bathyarchaeia archaeon]|nr:nickel-dependent lactate racemase [Candidatus Bathyarchaeia archaeon]